MERQIIGQDITSSRTHHILQASATLNRRYVRRPVAQTTPSTQNQNSVSITFKNKQAQAAPKKSSFHFTFPKVRTKNTRVSASPNNPVSSINPSSSTNSTSSVSPTNSPNPTSPTSQPNSTSSVNPTSSPNPISPACCPSQCQKSLYHLCYYSQSS